MVSSGMALKESSLSTRQYFDEITHLDQEFYRSGLVVHKQVDFTPDTFVELVSSDSSPYVIVPSSDGLVAVVQEKPVESAQPADFSHTSDFFDLHKDGLYYPQLPWLTLLHCANEGTSGIPTFFVDTRVIWKKLSEEQKEILSKLELVYEKKDGTTHIRDIVELHSQTNKPFINLGSTRTSVRQKSSQRASVSLRESTKTMNTVFDIADEVATPHTWQTGQVVLFDNQRYVHGRGKPTKETTEKDELRKLHRIWLASRS